MSPTLRGRLLWLGLFSLAFGYIEAAVVVYLREPYYPGGFQFPVVPMPGHLLRTEIIREAATLLLLLSVARLSARRGLHQLGVFAYCFGLWDLVYYLALKVLVDWPASLLDWDILFLIPLPWAGPVVAPIAVSLALVAGAVFLLRLPEDGPSPFRRIDWLVEGAAGLAIIASFLWNLPALAAEEIPSTYPWWLFGMGLGGGAGWFAWRLTRHWQQPASAGRL
ncbi:MAG: hypothetical protein V3U35_03440 [Candidatus Neomarinimicrobiota bacterium]